MNSKKKIECIVRYDVYAKTLKTLHNIKNVIAGKILVSFEVKRTWLSFTHLPEHQLSIAVLEHFDETQNPQIESFK
jgi:hypothetical protein